VRRGQVIAVVDTSKAAVDVEIWRDGRVQALLVEPGTKIPVGAAMMMVGDAEPGSVIAPPVAPIAPVAPVAPVAPAPSPAAPSSAAPSSAAPVGHRLPSAAELIAGARHPVSPAARKRGRELDVDVERLAGTGPHGAVTLADVERAAATRDAVGAPAGAAGPAPVRAEAAPSPRAPVTASPSAAAAAVTRSVALADRQAAMRASIAAAMSRAKREIPHYYLSEPIPMARALDWLHARNAAVPITERVLPAALLLKAVALALARVPELNGTMRDGRFVPSAAVHAGVAIALRGGGLVAPALHDVHDTPLAPLMHALADLVRRARAGSLRSSEMSDPTITVTQLGDQGVESVFGVIYPPQVAIVGFGRIAERPWAQDGWLRALPVVTATLSADHRVSDGHRGALFLAELRERLQQPDTLDGGQAPGADAAGAAPIPRTDPPTGGPADGR
jgi:pyruvate dehydrogenase E2 component (dihydrolipoamide acetyltransferase)